MKKSIVIIFFLLLCFSLRFYKIEEAGLWTHDEGSFLLCAKTPYVAIKYILSERDFSLKGLSDYLAKEGGIVSDDAKPTYILLLFILSFFTNLSDYTGKLLSAIADTLTCLGIFLICRLHSVTLAVFSCLLFSILPPSVFWGKLTVANPLACTFLIFSIYFYLKRKLFQAGLLFGLSFTCHYFVFWQIFLFFFFEIFQKRKNFLKSIGLILIGFFIPIVLWECISFLAILFIKSKVNIEEYNINLLSYFQQLLYQFKKRIAHPPFYSPSLYFLLNFKYSFGLFILTLAALIFNFFEILKKPKKSFVFFIFIEFLFILCFFLTVKYQVGRNFCVVFPLQILFVCLFLERLFYFRKLRLLSILLFLSLTIESLIKLPYILNLKSNYKQVVFFLKKPHLSTQDPISQFYLGMDNSSYPIGENTKEALEYARKRNFKYLLVDYMQYTKHYEMAQELKKIGKKIYQISNPIGNEILILTEAYRISEIKSKKDLDKIEIYLLPWK